MVAVHLLFLCFYSLSISNGPAFYITFYFVWRNTFIRWAWVEIFSQFVDNFVVETAYANFRWNIFLVSDKKSKVSNSKKCKKYKKNFSFFFFHFYPLMVWHQMMKNCALNSIKRRRLKTQVSVHFIAFSFVIQININFTFKPTLAYYTLVDF